MLNRNFCDGQSASYLVKFTSFATNYVISMKLKGEKPKMFEVERGKINFLTRTHKRTAKKSE